MEELKRGTHSS